jgi:hypothetical protein
LERCAKWKDWGFTKRAPSAIRRPWTWAATWKKNKIDELKFLGKYIFGKWVLKSSKAASPWSFFLAPVFNSIFYLL